MQHHSLIPPRRRLPAHLSLAALLGHPAVVVPAVLAALVVVIELAKASA